MLLRRKLAGPVLSVLIYSGFGLLVALAIVLRVALYHVETSDYTVFVSRWYEYIQSHGGFAALKDNFSNYNTPYLYLLALATYVPVPELIAIKTLSVVFDGILGVFTYLLIRLKYQRSYAVMAGMLVMLFAPTIFINSAAWGQADATYAAFCLGSLYFLLKERPYWACVLFGLAVSFKLQAIFFLPVLLMLLLKRKLPLRALAFIPAVFLLLLVPALIAGRDAWSLLTIYAGQVASGGVGGGGQFNGQGTGGRFGGQGPFGGAPGQFGGQRGQFNGGRPGGFSSSSLTLNAPSFYQWLPTNAPETWKWVGIGLAGLFIICIGVLLWRSRERMTAAILVKIALVFAIAIPFFLPEMHERYFFLADVVSIIYVFYFPRLFFVAVLMQLCSLLSYAPYLMNTTIISLSFVAFMILLLVVITVVDLVFALYPGLRERLTLPDDPVEEASAVGVRG